MVDALEAEFLPDGERLRTASATAAVNQVGSIAFQLGNLPGKVIPEKVDQLSSLEVSFPEFTGGPDVDDDGARPGFLGGEEKGGFFCVDMDDGSGLGECLSGAGQRDCKTEKKEGGEHPLHAAKNTGPLVGCKRSGQVSTVQSAADCVG